MVNNGGGVVPGIYDCEGVLLVEYLLGALCRYLDVEPYPARDGEKDMCPGSRGMDN